MTALRQFLHFVLRILVFSLVLAGIHYLLAVQTNITPSVQDIFKMHIFVVVLTIGGYGVLSYIGYRDHNKIGFAFLGLIVIKMMVSFAFLYPYLKEPAAGINIMILNFFAVYFLFLAFEVREVYELIQKGASLEE